jgi:hypothetical protein
MQAKGVMELMPSSLCFCVAALLVGSTLSCAVSESAWADERTLTNSAPEAVQIPFQLIGPSAPLVNVRIQNREILLELDIGDSSALVLHPSVLSSLSTAPTGESSRGYGMEGKVFDLPIVRVKRVEIGTAVFADVSIHADSHDDAFRKQQLTERGTQGYIGTGLFKGYKLVLNYRRHLLTLMQKDVALKSQSSCRGQMIPLVRSVNWGLVSSAHTDGGDALFVWDTGAPGLAIVKANAAAIHVDVSRDTVSLKHFDMNGHEFGPLQFHVWDFPAPPGMVGMLGYDFFRDHTVCIDFAGNQLFVR